MTGSTFHRYNDYLHEKINKRNFVSNADIFKQILPGGGRILSRANREELSEKQQRGCSVENLRNAKFTVQ